MLRIIVCVSILACSPAIGGAAMLQKAVTPYSSWSGTEAAFRKDCAADGAQLSGPAADPKTMVGATMRNLRQMYIPTALAFKASLDSETKNKLEAIDKAAKAKALEVLKVSKKFPLELAQKSSGLGLTSEAQLVPEDFLQKFNYREACECLHNTQNVARDEAEYNALTAEEFMIRQEHNKVKCFVQNATLRLAGTGRPAGGKKPQ